MLVEHLFGEVEPVVDHHQPQLALRSQFHQGVQPDVVDEVDATEHLDEPRAVECVDVVP